MVLPSSSVLSSDETVEKVSVSVTSKNIRSSFSKKGAKKLSRRRRKAKRRRDRYFKERKQMACVSKGPYDYYWGNYFRCVKWVQNHHASYWKSRAQALEYENKMLRVLVDRSSSQHNFAGVSAHSHDCRNNLSYTENIGNPADGEIEEESEAAHQNYGFDYTEDANRIAHSDKRDIYYDECENDDEEFEFEVDDNMIEFFTQSMKHKLELQRERGSSDNRTIDHSAANSGTSRMRKKKFDSVEEDESSYDACIMGLKKVLPTQCFEQNEAVEAKNLQDILLKKAQREENEKEKQELFGQYASKILAMETALQLNFRQVCASKQPVMWPIIPFNM